jgi:E3 UFM1-protein ligase 1
MEEITALQSQLAAVQVSTSASKLSERNVIDIVSKLRALSLIDLIFTRSGNEYLTPSHLVREIHYEILVRGGRVNVIDLPDALNVDLAHIDNALPAVIAASTVPIRVVNGEFVTDDYLTTLASDINAGLLASVSGVDHLGAIASRTNLPVEVVRNCVRAHVGTSLAATFDENSGILRSHVSRARAAAVTRGALRAIATPTVLADFAVRHDVPVGIVVDVAEAMLASGKLGGRLEGSGSRAMFVPAVFERAANEAAISMFETSGFLTADRLGSIGVSDPNEFVRQHTAEPGALILGSGRSNVIISESLIETIEASAAEAINTGSWLDVVAALPIDFPQEFVVDVVSHFQRVRVSTFSLVASTTSCSIDHLQRGVKGDAKRKGQGSFSAPSAADMPGHYSSYWTAAPALWRSMELDALILRGKFLISRSIFDRCSACVKRDADKFGKIRAKRITDDMAVVGKRSEVISEYTGGGGDDNEHRDVGGRNESGKIKARRRRNKVLTATTTSQSNSSEWEVSVNVPSVEEICLLLLKDEYLAVAFSSDYLGNATLDEPRELIRAIVEEGLLGGNFDSIALLYKYAVASAVEEIDRDRTATKTDLETQITTGLEQAEAFNTAADTLRALTKSAAEASKEHVLATVCVKTVFVALHLVANSLGIRESHAEQPASPDALQQLLEQLPSDVAAKARPLLSSVSGKRQINAGVVANVEDDEGVLDIFLHVYDACAPALDLPERRPLDMRRKLACWAGLRAANEMFLQNVELTTIDALRIVATLLHARCVANGAIVSLPLERVLELCASLEKHAEPESVCSALADFRQAVVDDLRSRPRGAPPPVSGHLIQKLQAIEAFIKADYSAVAQ